ncbi:MAG: phosphatidylserine decarboxylase [Candidatus Omnitrophica bacterium]|nr:phosphatidylserine decarboxylase [Candidatus Omnitrophota bacterium]
MLIAKEGLPYIGSSMIVNIFLLKTAPYLGLVSLPLTFFLVFFFRDPKRIPPAAEDAVLSPADGRITEAEDGKISIYLSLFDVHVNRSPVAGTVALVKYSPGRFHPACGKKALTENENNLIDIVNGRVKVTVRQIAGRFARRIVCYCKEKDTLRHGDRIGMIKFGSCVQVYLPGSAVILVRPGEKVRAGQTVLAALKQ